MAKLWRIHAHEPARVEALGRSAGVPSVVAQLLLCRGIHEPDQVRDFLDPRLSLLRDPFELPGMEAAVDCISRAIAAKSRITIYGDYDVDGMTGTSILWQCLKLLGADVNYYVPNRIEEGYGLNDEALRTLAQQGTKLVVTVDCGIASLNEALTAQVLGLELVVTDHHEPAATPPEATAIVHPRLHGHFYPFTGLSGSGVALKVAWALCQRADNSKKVSDRLRIFLLGAVGLAALGTVADVVPLVDENRVLVQYGLQSLKDRPGTGLAALMRITQLATKPRLDGDDLGFTISPRLNAAGRFGQAQLGIELLTTTNEERAQALAEYIHELNGSRQSLERSIYLAANKQATEQFDPEGDAALVLAGAGWHPGVIGIVAGRLAEKFHRPVVLIALDELGSKPGVGSARSVPGFNLHAALQSCSQHLLAHGGHAAAAGLKIEPSKVDAFRTDFCEFASTEIDHGTRTAELWIDAEVPLGALSLSVVEQIERMSPFGQGNRRPLFCASSVQLAEPPKPMGEGGRHLSFKLRQGQTGIRGVAFGAGEWLDALQQHDGPVDIAFRPVINEFRGNRKVELQLTDWRVSS
ncbi:MAG: single-stranded-DNA-specific exonuclease RecJ [Planctomycetaceae bacterium]|nr:single-stranded-DNA-specific exonuclease RecJ [Planctomycetaceae bacterium]